MVLKDILEKPGGMAIIIGVVVVVLWLVENGILQNQMANKQYVDDGDQATRGEIISRLDRDEATRKAQQLSDMIKTRCDPDTDNRYDEIWHSLLDQFERLRGDPFRYPECAR